MDVANDFPVSCSPAPDADATRGRATDRAPRREVALASLGPVLALCPGRAQCSGRAIARALVEACRAARPRIAVHLDSSGVLEALHWPQAGDAPMLVRLPDTDLFAWDRLGDDDHAARWPWPARVPALATAGATIARHAAPRSRGFAVAVRCEPRADRAPGMTVRPVSCLSVLAWRTLDALRALGDYELVLADP